MCWRSRSLAAGNDVVPDHREHRRGSMLGTERMKMGRTARHTRRRRGYALSAALIGVVLCGSAFGQDDAQHKAAAEALFDEGRSLAGQGQYEAACQRFEQSQAMDPGVGTLLYLGDCYERVGRVASAWAMYRAAASAAGAAAQVERSRIASERAQRLTPYLSKLVLAVPAENRVSGFELSINGKPLSAALF